jgi:hypothetical protein
MLDRLRLRLDLSIRVPDMADMISSSALTSIGAPA